MASKLKKIEAALANDKIPRSKILSAVRKVNKEAAIPWEEAPAHLSDKGKACEKEIVEWLNMGNEGSTFREIEVVMEDDSFHVGFIKSVVKSSPIFKLKPRTDKKKYYGNYPYGVYFSEEAYSSGIVKPHEVEGS